MSDCGSDDDGEDERSVVPSGAEDDDTDEEAQNKDFGTKLLKSLEDEWKELKEKTDKRAKYGEHKGDSYPCEICVCKAFQKRDRVKAHLEDDHKPPHFCTSSKHLAAVKAAWAERCAAMVADKFVSAESKGSEANQLLRDTGGVLRRMLKSSPSFDKLGTALANVDRVTAWVLTLQGMKLFIKCDAEALEYRRLGDYYYTEEFLKQILAWSLDPSTKGSVVRVRNKMLHHFVSCGADLPFMIPSRKVVDRLQAQAAKSYPQIIHRCRQALKDREAFRSITVDGTFKFLMAVLGQPKHGAKRTDSDRPGKHVVMTGRAIDGSMFWSEAMSAENVPEILPKMAAIEGIFEQTEILGSDRPQDWDNTLTFAALPRLECITGDFYHIVFAAASCYGTSMKPAVVVCLRKLANKWCVPGSNAWFSSPYYVRHRAATKPYTSAEQQCWEAPVFTAETARKFLDEVDDTMPFKSRLEYLKLMGALKVCFADQLQRKAGDYKTTLGKLLERAVGCQMVEYLANASRWRSKNSMDRACMASGSVGNEAHHADLKAWGRNIIAMTLERATLVLTFWNMSKLLRHESSFFSPNPRKQDEQEGHWLTRVLLKATCTACYIKDEAVAKRTGRGNEHDLRNSSVAPVVVIRRPAAAVTKKRPASIAPPNKPRFQTVWKRPSTNVLFQKRRKP
jgi:hypothetical protein